MKNKTKYRKNYFLLAVILLSIFTYTLFNSQKSNDIRSRASEQDDAIYCVNPPECCARMDQSHSAYECAWPIRGYCRNCGSIEGRGERCGWYWLWHDGETNKPNGYACMIGDTEATMRPKYSSTGATTTPPTPTAISQPTTALIPTTLIFNPTPTQIIVQPTQTVIIPTVPINPTTPPVPTIPSPNNTINFPTSPAKTQIENTKTSQPIIQLPQLPILQFPKLNFSHLKPQINNQKINEAVSKPLGFFEYIFERVAYYDKKLENAIDDNIRTLLKSK